MAYVKPTPGTYGDVRVVRTHTARHKTPWTWRIDNLRPEVFMTRLWAIPPVKDGIYIIPSEDKRYGRLNILDQDKNDLLGSYDVRGLMDVYWRYALQAGGDFADQVARVGQDLERMKRGSVGDAWSHATLELLQAWVAQHQAYIPVFQSLSFTSGQTLAVSHSDYQGHPLPPIEFQVTMLVTKKSP